MFIKLPRIAKLVIDRAHARALFTCVCREKIKTVRVILFRNWSKRGRSSSSTFYRGGTSSAVRRLSGDTLCLVYLSDSFTA